MQYATRILKPSEYRIAADLLRLGKCVAFPTETVYGLGANALDAKAVSQIFAVKGRPSDNPLIVHCHNQQQVRELTMPWSKEVQTLMDVFWPGPLTLVLPKRPIVPQNVTGNLDTVAIRIPDHPIALNIIRAAHLPIAAPSANQSGKPSPTRAEHVWQDMAGKIPAIVDGGPTGWGLESTVLDCTSLPFKLLRPGGITPAQLQRYADICSTTDEPSESDEPPRSPGMKYKHYSPEAQVILITGNKVPDVIAGLIHKHSHLGERVAVMAFSESMELYTGALVLEMGSRNNLQAVAARIYHLLRKTDTLGCTLVLIEGLPESDTDLGMAIMNRLRKASDSVIVT